jgi:hypothetical protein
LGVLCAAGYNVRWLLRMIRQKGIRLYLALIKELGLAALLAKNPATNDIDGFRRAQLVASIA